MGLSGDARHEAAAAGAAAVDRAAPHVLALTRSDVPVLVPGSTWPSDEAVLLPAVAEVRQRQRLALVIAPHEPGEAHLAALERAMPCSRLSQLERTPDDWETCLVDRVGILAEPYAGAAIAFVGGGF